MCKVLSQIECLPLQRGCLVYHYVGPLYRISDKHTRCPTEHVGLRMSAQLVGRFQHMSVKVHFAGCCRACADHWLCSTFSQALEIPHLNDTTRNKLKSAENLISSSLINDDVDHLMQLIIPPSSPYLCLSHWPLTLKHGVPDRRTPRPKEPFLQAESLGSRLRH